MPEPETAANNPPVRLKLLKPIYLWLALTIVYAIGVFIAGARDWGDSSYNQNPGLQLHDKMFTALDVGILSGIYIAVITWQALRTGRGQSKTVRILLLVIFVTLTLILVSHVAGGQVNSITSEAGYVQNQ